MDLVCARVAGPPEAATIYRMSWQPVSALPSAERAAAWRPDGKLIAVGNAEGEICVFHAESASLVATHEPCRLHSTAIASLSWTSEPGGRAEESEDDLSWVTSTGQGTAAGVRLLERDPHARHLAAPHDPPWM